MHIICPHCTTSYAIDLATLGVSGRTVRCSRCKEVWLARPEDAVAAPVMAAASPHAEETDAASEWEALARDDDGMGAETPEVASPSIAGDGTDGKSLSRGTAADWSSMARQDADRIHREALQLRPG